MRKSTFLGLIFLWGIGVLTLFVILGIASIRWNINVGGHIKRAADANTIEIAKKELDLVINYLDRNKITEGHSSVFWSTPSTDIGFWYNNLKEANKELQKATPETSQLEKTNLLMKLRETLLDHGEKGDLITQPENIEVYPNQSLIAFLFCIAFFSFIILIFFAMISLRIQF